MKARINYHNALVEFDFTGSGLEPIDLSQIVLTTLEKIMSALTPKLQQLVADLNTAKTEAAALKLSNSTIGQTVTELQIQLDAANQNAASAEDVLLIDTAAQLSTDLKNDLSV